jgi:hypothetical protein
MATLKERTAPSEELRGMYEILTAALLGATAMIRVVVEKADQANDLLNTEMKAAPCESLVDEVDFMTAAGDSEMSAVLGILCGLLHHFEPGC